MRAYYSVLRTLQTASTDTQLSEDLKHIHTAHTSLCGHTYWLEACLRNSSSVCLKVSKRHLFTVFSTLMTSPIIEEQDNKLLGNSPFAAILLLYCDQEHRHFLTCKAGSSEFGLESPKREGKTHTHTRKHSPPGAITQTRRPMPALSTAPPAHPRARSPQPHFQSH